MTDDITVIIPTSVLPSHPSTAILDETIASIRHHLPKSEIILQIDGVRQEQLGRTEDYNKYITKVLWKCLHKWKNVLPIMFSEHSHQTNMMKATIDLIKTPLLLYVEADCPLVLDETIDWVKCIQMIYSGEANTVRFHFEGVIPKEHEHLMLGEKNGFMRTVQWSQRPHLSSVLYYKDVILPTVREKYFIEDTFHGTVMIDWDDHGQIGWNKHRLWIYYPDKKNIKRSYTTDGRQGGLKFTSDDEVGL
jgi:hypothetical protein